MLLKEQSTVDTSSVLSCRKSFNENHLHYFKCYQRGLTPHTPKSILLPQSTYFQCVSVDSHLFIRNCKRIQKYTDLKQ